MAIFFVKRKMLNNNYILERYTFTRCAPPFLYCIKIIFEKTCEDLPHIIFFLFNLVFKEITIIIPKRWGFYEKGRSFSFT